MQRREKKRESEPGDSDETLEGIKWMNARVLESIRGRGYASSQRYRP
jgi:hypothetical protein